MGQRGAKGQSHEEITAPHVPVTKRSCPIRLQRINGESVTADLSDCWNMAEVRGAVAQALDIPDMQVLLIDDAVELDDSVSTETFPEGHFISVVLREAENPIRVCCRIRPLDAIKQENGDAEVLTAVNPQMINLEGHGTFGCDSIFAPGSQEDIFNECKDIIQSVMNGSTGAILAYGQTRAGKSHTMFGNDGAAQLGVTQQSFAEILRLIKQRGIREWKITVSFCELRGSEVKDLNAERLLPEPDQRFKLAHLIQKDCNNVRDLQRMFSDGQIKRSSYCIVSCGPPACHTHAIVIFRVALTDPSTQQKLNGTLFFGDLAGSEVPEKETQFTRKAQTSLSRLSDVLDTLANGRRTLPHKWEKLTYILQEALNSSCKTLLFVALSPASTDLEETRKSLDFAAKTGRVVKKDMNQSMELRTTHENYMQP